MPEPRTKYGPFCARAGIVIVAKRERMGARLECIICFFFFWPGGWGRFLSFNIKSETLSLYNNKQGDVEVKKKKKKKTMEKNVRKRE